MGVLDTFFILFKTDADEAAVKTKKLADETDRAEEKLRKTDATATRLAGSFLGIAAALAAPIVAMVSFGGALNAVYARIDQIGNIGDAALKLRSTTADYDAFTRAVRAAGGEMQAAQENLAKFSDKLNDAAARPDGPNAKNFAKWGIAFKDVNGEAVGAVDGLLALAASLENVSQAEALGRLRRLGIEDADTIDFLLQGKQAILDKMDAEKRAGVVTDRQIELEGQYQSAVGKTRNMLDTFAGIITEAVLPAMIGAYNAFNRVFGWLLQNRTLVTGFFIGVATAITVYFLPALYAAAAAVLAATWPFVAIGAVIAALGAAFALAYEDVMAFMNGQPSLIGELAKRYQWFADIIRGIGAVYEWLESVVSAVLGEMPAAWEAVVTAVTDAWAAIQPVFEAIGQGVQVIIAVLVEAYTPIVQAWGALAEAIGNLMAALFGRIGGVVKDIVDTFANDFRDISTQVSAAFESMSAALEPFKGDIQAAANAIAEIFRVMAGIIKGVWQAAIQFMADQVQWVADKINAVTALITGGSGKIGGTVIIGGQQALDAVNPNNAPPVPGGGPQPSPARNVSRAQYLLDGATNSPMGATTSAGLAAANTNIEQRSTVNVGAVNVQTQAPDAQSMARAARSALQSELRGTAAQFDDGVAR